MRNTEAEEKTLCTVAVSLMRTWPCLHHQLPWPWKRESVLPNLGCCVTDSRISVLWIIWLVEPRSDDFTWLLRSLGRWVCGILGISNRRKYPQPRLNNWRIPDSDRALDTRELEWITHVHLSVNISSNSHSLLQLSSFYRKSSWGSELPCHVPNLSSTEIYKQAKISVQACSLCIVRTN